MALINKDKIIRLKIHFDRARMYIGYIQFLMILFVTLNSFNSSFINDYLFKYWYLNFPIILILFVLICIIIGYLDLKLGFREKENAKLSTQNPVVIKILNDLEIIKNNQYSKNFNVSQL